MEVQAPALFARGRAYLFWNKYDIAVTVFEQLNREYPYSPEAAEALSVRTILALMHNDEDAKQNWVKSLFLRWKHSFTEAYSLLQSMAENSPDALYVPYILMDLYETALELKQTELAYARLKELVERFPDSPLAPRALHISIEHDPDIEDKHDAYVEFLQRYPDSYEADLVRGELEPAEQDVTEELP